MFDILDGLESVASRRPRYKLTWNKTHPDVILQGSESRERSITECGKLHPQGRP